MEKHYCPVCGEEAESINTDYGTGRRTVDCIIHGVQVVEMAKTEGQGSLFGKALLSEFVSCMLIMLLITGLLLVFTTPCSFSPISIRCAWGLK